MDKLKFQTNVPAEIALKYAAGKPMSGDYGDSVMYSLTDGRLWFAEPICAKKIEELNIAPGELFRVCKAEVTRGNRRSIEWQIARAEALRAAAATAVSPAPPTSTQAAGTAPAPTAIPSPRGRDMSVYINAAKEAKSWAA